jgi:ubiquinone/menaquinone biosynthesis C-methylase UbiE
MDERKQKEAEFHDKLRNEKLKESIVKYQCFTSNRKFYSITRESINFLNNYLFNKYKGKRVLDYCCGDGNLAISLAKKGIEIVGIDISEVSIKNSKNLAEKEGIENKTSFFIMDAEKTEFPDNYFDGIICAGVLHHLKIENAFKEMARILNPAGTIICNEPLAYNPIFQLYRRLTPHLRTKWEMKHILNKKDIKLAENYFGKVEAKFFHLSTLLAVPFRDLFFFNSILGALEKIDSIILKLPGFQWWAWQIIFILSKPKK